MIALPGVAGLSAQTATIAVVQQPPQPEDPGGRGEDFGKSSPVGLLVLILFLVAVALLARSMTRHLKRVPASFDQKDAEAVDAPPAGTPEGSERSADRSRRTEKKRG